MVWPPSLKQGIQKDIYLIDSLQKKDLLKLRIYAMIENDPSIDHFIRMGKLKTDLLNVIPLRFLVPWDPEERHWLKITVTKKVTKAACWFQKIH